MDRKEEQHYIKKEHITKGTNGEYQDPLATSDPVPITFEILKKEEVDIKEEDLHPDDVSKHADPQYNLNEHEYGDADNTLCSDGDEEDLDNKSLIFRFLENKTKSGSRQNVEENVSINEVREYSSAFQCNDDMNPEHVTNMSNKKNDEIYNCGECNTMFSQYHYLKNHITATHQSRVSDITSNKYNFSHTDEQINIKLNKSYACAECDKSYASIIDVRNHNKTVHLGNSYYKCVACNKTYFHTDKLKQHSCLVQKYECQICKKQFLYLSHLKQHSVAHNGEIQYNFVFMEKKYICDVCHKKFAEFEELKHHINAKHFMGTPISNESFKLNQKSVAENSEQKYVCYECGLKFFEFSQIKNHINESHCQEIIKTGKEMSIDTENKKHACKHCDKIYNIMTDLTEHIKTVHLGPDKYLCDQCHESFSQPSLLKMHTKLAHKNEDELYACSKGGLYACSACDERYTYHQDLTSHISEDHSGNGYYKCVICNKIIKRPHHLTRHYRDVHKNLWVNFYRHLNNIKHVKLECKSQNETKFECSDCNKKFFHFSEIKDHINESHNEEIYRNKKRINVNTEDNTLACEYCSKTYYKIHNLKHHIKTVHLGTEKYQCEHCHKTLSQPYLLKMHTKLLHKNNDGGLYACSSCDEKYLHHHDLTYHISEKHSGKGYYKCVICNTISKSPHHLTHHYKVVHKNLCLNLERLKSRKYVRFYTHVKNKGCVKVESKAKRENKFECGDCNKRFFEYSFLKAHIFRTHSEKESVKDNFPLKDKIYACSTCSEGYAWITDLKHHIDSSHSGIGGYQCRLCNKTIFCYNRVKKHMYAIHKYKELNYFHYSKIFSCDDCGKKYSTFERLHRHINGMHLRIGGYKCKQCNKIYSGLSVLRRHYKSEKHKNFMKFECDHCKKKFSHFSFLKVHIGVHSRSKNIECAHCGKKFFIFSDLKEHINRAHLKIRDLQCEHCGKNFANSITLQTHVNAVHENLRKFECEFCSKKFKTMTHLQNHVVCVHERVKKFVCEQCGNRFLLAHHLRSHVNAIHNGIIR